MQQLTTLNSLTATKDLAKKIASVIPPSFVVSLTGELGAGKTTLVQNILKEFGITTNVKSPTFTYVEPYQASHMEIYHFDLYRFSNPYEWLDLGFNDYFKENSICFIEWAERANGLIPIIDWDIQLNMMEDIRYCKIISCSDKGDECLNLLIAKDANLSS